MTTFEIILHLYDEQAAEANRNHVALPSRAVCKLPDSQSLQT